ncbi:MAG: hypothetical protein N4A49_00225 [Marinifilaceae bacterium]|nr:hypothetical protein [Marinifilaceae bacterium]
MAKYRFILLIVFFITASVFVNAQNTQNIQDQNTSKYSFLKFRFSVINVKDNQRLEYQEVHLHKNKSGFILLELGKGTTQYSLEDIDLVNCEYYIKTEVLCKDYNHTNYIGISIDRLNKLPFRIFINAHELLEDKRKEKINTYKIRRTREYEISDAFVNIPVEFRKAVCKLKIGNSLTDKKTVINKKQSDSDYPNYEIATNKIKVDSSWLSEYCELKNYVERNMVSLNFGFKYFTNQRPYLNDPVLINSDGKNNVIIAGNAIKTPAIYCYDKKGMQIWKKDIKLSMDILDLKCTDKFFFLLAEQFIRTKQRQGVRGETNLVVFKYDYEGKLLNEYHLFAANTRKPIKIQCDNEANIYIAGHYNKKIIFGNRKFVNENKVDNIFIAKIDKYDDLQWMNSYPAIEYSKLGDISLDKQNNIILGGVYNKQIQFGKLNEYDADENYNAFILKIDKSGKEKWIRNFESEESMEIKAITCDKSNNIFFAGDYNDKLSFSKDKTITCVKSTDCYIAKLSSKGKFEWVESANGRKYDYALNLKCDDNDNVYFIGMYNSKLLAFHNTEIRNNSFLEMFISKYSNSGNCIWAKSTGGNDSEINGSVAIIKDILIFSGEFYSKSDLNKLRKTNNDLTKIWRYYSHDDISLNNHGK